MMLKSKNYKLSFFLYFLLFGILVEIITIGAVYIHSHYNLLEQFKTKYKLESSIKKSILSEALSQTKLSIDSIIENPIFKEYLNDNSKTNKNLVQYLFLSISQEHPNYMQVRYIDNLGDEIIRIDKDTNSKIIENKNLQNKADRYYFKDTMGTKQGKFWFSKLDLNVEKGMIEIPFRPTLRIAKKIFHNGKSDGMIIINISMDNLLKNLVKSSDFNIDLVDGDGNYIYSSKIANSWSVDLKSGKNVLKRMGITSLTNKEFEKNNVYLSHVNDIFKTSQDPHLVFTKKYDIVKEIKKQDMFVSALIVLFVLLVSIPIAYFISSIPLTLQKQLGDTTVDLQKFSNIVDKYVMSMILDENSHILSVSTSFCSMAGYNADELIGKHCSFVLTPKSNIKQMKNMSFEQYISASKELDAIASDGHIFCVEYSITPTLDEEGNVQDRTIFLTDITKRKEMEKRSLTDSLTNIYNRAGIDKFLFRELELSLRHDTPLSVIMADIDFFKNVNDAYGHQAGDTVLIELANIFKSSVRDTDIVGRFGGEEFLIILPQTDKEGSVTLAETLRKKIERYDFSIHSTITVSFGVATCTEKETPETIIQRSDEALYEAKQTGRNRVCFKA